MFFKLNYGNGLHVFSKGVDKDLVSLLTTIASKLENQDVINTTIVGILADPKEVRGLPFIIQ